MQLKVSVRFLLNLVKKKVFIPSLANTEQAEQAGSYGGKQ